MFGFLGKKKPKETPEQEAARIRRNEIADEEARLEEEYEDQQREEMIKGNRERATKLGQSSIFDKK